MSDFICFLQSSGYLDAVWYSVNGKCKIPTVNPAAENAAELAMSWGLFVQHGNLLQIQAQILPGIQRIGGAELMRNHIRGFTVTVVEKGVMRLAGQHLQLPSSQAPPLVSCLCKFRIFQDRNKPRSLNMLDIKHPEHPWLWKSSPARTLTKTHTTKTWTQAT